MTAASEDDEARQVPAADVRLLRGRLSAEELAAVAVVVSAMSVTSRLEAEERALAGGPGSLAGGGWSDGIHTHPRAHGLRALPSPAAWLFGDR